MCCLVWVLQQPHVVSLFSVFCRGGVGTEGSTSRAVQWGLISAGLGIWTKAAWPHTRLSELLHALVCTWKHGCLLDNDYSPVMFPPPLGNTEDVAFLQVSLVRRDAPGRWKGDRCGPQPHDRSSWRQCLSLTSQAYHLFLICTQVVFGVKYGHLSQELNVKGIYFWLVEETCIC